MPLCILCSREIGPAEMPVLLTNGRRVHLRCPVPLPVRSAAPTLTVSQRVQIVLRCFDHSVASCSHCHGAYRYHDLRSWFVSGRRVHFCPSCGAELEAALVQHHAECPQVTKRSEVHRSKRAVAWRRRARASPPSEGSARTLVRCSAASSAGSRT